MSTYINAGVSVIFQLCLHYFVLAKLATSSIRVKGKIVLNRNSSPHLLAALVPTRLEDGGYCMSVADRTQVFLTSFLQHTKYNNTVRRLHKLTHSCSRVPL